MDKITSSLTPRQSDYDQDVKSIRQRLDSVRMNLGAELAELRQRRDVAQKSLSELMESGTRVVNAVLTVYSVIMGVKGILSFFRKGEQAKKERRDLLKGLVVQASVYAAKRAMKYYQEKQSIDQQVKTPLTLLLPSPDKLQDMSLEVRSSDSLELFAPPAVPVSVVNYSNGANTMRPAGGP